MTTRRYRRLLGSLWFVPVVCLLAGVSLAAATIAVDRVTGGSLLPRSLTGDPNAALAILSTAAASMVSLTALVLTITGVVVQLAMGQFSPRSVRPFLQDRPSQLAIGVFVGTFAQSVLALREVRSFGGDGSVPSLTITVSFVLILVSVVVLVAYVHHIGHSLKVDSIIRSVGDETRELLEGLYADPHRGAPVQPRDAVLSDRTGNIFDVDDEALVAEASRSGCRLLMLQRIGDFVARDQPLFQVVDGTGTVDADAIRSAVEIGPERTMDRDPAFGIQTLVDIALRSLTESFNDPTTAAQAVDRIHDCLRLLVTRDLGTGEFRDGDGRLRLTVPILDWEGYVALGFDAIQAAAQGTPQVLERVRAALDDLRTVASPERRHPLAARLRALESHNDVA